jgi:hypothetical protein
MYYICYTDFYRVGSSKGHDHKMDTININRRLTLDDIRVSVFASVTEKSLLSILFPQAFLSL